MVTGAGAGMGKQITTDFLKNGVIVITVKVNDNSLNTFYEVIKS